MSMVTYAVDDYGIVLTKDDLKKICMHLYTDCTEDAWEEDEQGFIDILRANIGLSMCGNYTGEAFAIGKDGRDQYWNTMYFTGETIYYMAIMRYPTLFSGAYDCFEDMVNDFKVTMSEYVPEEFDFSNVRHIVGTYS